MAESNSELIKTESAELVPAKIRGETGGITDIALGIRAKRALQIYSLTGNARQALTQFVFPTTWNFGGGGTGSSILSGEGWLSVAPRDFPYEKINAYNSSIVMACVNWITGAFREARPRVFRLNDKGEKNYLPTHRLARLIKRPNAYYGMSKLMEATLISYYLDGNGYWFKERGDGGTGITRGLYYIPHYQIEPKAKSGNYIDRYEYNVNGQTFDIPPERIIHFRNGLDPYNPLKGRKILHPVFKEIYSDEEAASFTAALLKNTAIPAIVIVPDTEKVKVAPEDAKDLKENFKRKFGGDNRGEPLITNFAAKISQFGFSPEQLQLKEVRRLPEERIAAQFRLPPQVAGLGAGLDRNTYSNYEEAEQHAYRSVMIPVWDDFAEEMDLNLSGEFGGGDDNFGFEYDYANVRALNESQDSITNRAVKVFAVDGITRAELRQSTGYAVDETRDNVFLSEIRAANSRNGGNNPENGQAPQRAAKDLAGLDFFVKTLPPADYDNALEMSQETVIDPAIKQMQDDLYRMFGELSKTAEAEYRERAKENNNLDPQTDAEGILADTLKAFGLGLVLRAIWGRLGKSVTDDTITTVTLRLGISQDFADDVFQSGVKSVLLQMSQSYETDLIKQTRNAIETALRLAEQGASVPVIGKQLKALVSGKEMYSGVYQRGYTEAKAAGASDAEAERAGEAKARRYRAETIAETESRTFQNSVTLEAYAKTGAERVKVTDGDGCGWKTHDDKDKAHNSIRNISDARKYKLAHPRCKRRFFPVEDLT